MKWAVRLFDFYLDASIHVAFAVIALVQITAMIANIEHSWHISFYLFFGTISCYNFIKYGVEAEKYILVASRYHKNIQIASFIALALAFYHAYFLRWETWVGIGVISILTGLYALPIFPQTKNLRSLGLFKIFLVSLVWSGSTVVLPVVEAGVAFTWDVCIETIQRFALVLVLLIPFEIRDLEYDSPALRTLPQRLGWKTAKRIGGLIVILFFFLTFLKDKVSMVDLVAKGVLCVVLALFLRYTTSDQSKYFSSFWVESIPIFWWGVLWCLQHYF